MTSALTGLPSRARATSRAACSDDELLSLVAERDEAAFAELYDRFGAPSYGLALRILRDPALAEDAVQEALLAIWRSADRFRPDRGAARAWVLALVHRRAVDLVRREERRRPPRGVADRKSTRLNSSHIQKSRMPSSA